MALWLDTKVEINTAAPMTTPNSRNNLPNVLRKLLQKYRRKVIEMEITAKKFHLILDCSFYRCHTFNFLENISVTTIPSSTTSPAASNATSHNTFIEKPKSHIMKKIKDTGIINGLKAIGPVSQKGR
jgi:hypothetical protein